MYISRSEADGVLQGWIRDGRLDVFLWFDGQRLVQAQLCAFRDMAEWVEPGRLQTGYIREGLSLNPGAGLIDFDRRTSDERLERIREAITTANLWPEVRQLSLALLKRECPPELVSPIEAIVRASPPITPNS